MNLLKKDISIVRIQVVVWIFITLLMFLLFYHEGQRFVRSAAFAICNTIFYGGIMYTNACWLIPSFYRRNKKWLYVLMVILLLAVATWSIVEAESFLGNLLADEQTRKATKEALEKEMQKNPNMKLRLYMVMFFLSVLIFLFSLPLRLAFDYFTMRKQQEQLQKRTAEAELNLLKAQVQPHFLFNTLNNIYFVAQRESPATAVLLERLSNIMRYFVDEGPKEKIPLTREIDFIRDYIHLEKLRMRHPMQMDFVVKGETAEVSIPPMLLIPLVENVFKHGINKRSEENLLVLNITVSDGRLSLEVRNRIFGELEPAQHGGNGLANLKSRLELLYGDRYTLQTTKQDVLFLAHLTIPL